jgi:peptidoglycan/xylan/chitin deacetylase (PgdA/CDA1 family)
VHRLLRETVAFAVRRSGASFLVRNTFARNRVAIILYHDPRPETVEQHFAYLAKRYSFITLDDLADALGRGAWSSLPAKSVVVTIDDGLRGNFELLDVFKSYGVVPTIYICPAIVGSTRHYWFYEAGIDVESLKTWPNDERLRFLAARCQFTPTREYPREERQSLSREELGAMNSHVRFESHSMTHPVLTTCTDEECAREITQSRIEVTSLTGRECRHFSFPNGDYGDREIELVQRAGYSTARTVEVGWNDGKTDPFRLRLLTSACDDLSVNFLAAQMGGILWAKEVLKRVKRPARPRSAPPEQMTLRTIVR